MSEILEEYAIEDIKDCRSCTISKELKKEILSFLKEEKPKLKEFIGIAYYDYHDIEPNRIVEIYYYSDEDDLEYSNFVLVENVIKVQTHMNDIITEPILVVQVEGYDITCCM